MDQPRPSTGDEPREFRQIQRATVAELLDEVGTLHRKLAEYYRQAGDDAKDEHAALLLHYLESHEQFVRESLETYEENASQNILQSWFRYAQNIPVDKLIERAQELSKDATLDDVTRLTTELSDFLIGALETIAEQSAVPEVEEALTKMKEVEERAKIRALRGADEDMG